MPSVELYDSTLRDGTQQEGISLSVEEKLAITARLDALGVHYIEGGYAGANPKDDEYFRRVRDLGLSHSVVTAFGNTRKAGGRVETDPTIRALLDSGAEVITLVGKASEMQVRQVLETSLEENLAMIQESVEYVRSQDRRVIFDAEHFFDGYADNPEYSLQTVRAAVDGGAECVVLCDTNGGAMPDDIARALADTRDATGARLGIHTHNDADTAVAGTLAGVKAGAAHVQGTINGYGERCGNANLISVIANLKLKLGVDCVTDEQLSSLTEVSRFVAEAVNRRPFPFAPYVGASAFAHKGGLHADAMEKAAESYQHTDPAAVGNTSGVVVSELAGRSSVMRRIRELGLSAELTERDAREIVQYVKERENRGFAYEGAAASFELVVRRLLPDYRPPFELIDFMVLAENRRRTSVRDNGEGMPLYTEATIRVRVGGEVLHTAAEGNGPVNALDNALRKALLQYYPELEVVRLTDYKVRVVSESATTEAVVRVAIESADEVDTWQTVGSSPNILEASWLALADSMEWWLIRHRSR